MFRRILVWKATVMALAVLCFASSGLRSPEFNVLLISVDTLRADRLNSYGYDQHTVSPNIDRLAQDGILFENQIASSPWTTPSHMSMLTSLSPSAHGIVRPFGTAAKDLRPGMYNRLPEARVTLAETLQARGYATAAFTGGITIDPTIGFDQGFSVYETSMYKLNEQNVSTLFDWLGAHATVPFFLFWHTFEVHAPYLHAKHLPEPFWEIRSEYDELAKSASGEASLYAAHVSKNKKLRAFLVERGAFKRDVTEALYLGGIDSMDVWLGRLVAELRKRDLYDRTMIILTSDHGDEFADHDPARFYDHHGHSAYEELVRVPLIIKLPDQRYAGTRVSTVTRAIDIMPTVLDLLGVEPAQNEMQGESLRPLWVDPSTVPERVALTEASFSKDEVKSIRTSKFKYIIQIPATLAEKHGRSHIPDELYRRLLFNLDEDPDEKENLLQPARRASASDEAKRLDKLLRSMVTMQLGDVDQVQLDPDTIKRLKSLGYIQ